MRILNVEPMRYNSQARTILEKIGDVDYLNIDTNDELKKVAGSKPYSVLFVKLGLSIDEEVLDLMPQLKYIATPTTGLNHIDLEAAKKKNISVLSLKGETSFLNSIKSTAEHTWMLLLALIRKLPSASKRVNSGEWVREPFLGSEINGKNLGVIGYGRLGRIVSDYGIAFGAKVYVSDIDPDKTKGVSNKINVVELDTLLSVCDIITVHIPANESNRNFIGEKLFSKMKDGVVFINTSRGEVVDEEAFLDAIKSKKINGAAIDVISGDSCWEGTSPKDHPLIKYAQANNNLIITPHIGGYAIESINSTREFIANKTYKYIFKN